MQFGSRAEAVQREIPSTPAQGSSSLRLKSGFAQDDHPNKDPSCTTQGVPLRNMITNQSLECDEVVVQIGSRAEPVQLARLGWWRRGWNAGKVQSGDQLSEAERLGEQKAFVEPVVRVFPANFRMVSAAAGEDEFAVRQELQNLRRRLQSG